VTIRVIKEIHLGGSIGIHVQAITWDVICSAFATERAIRAEEFVAGEDLERRLFDQLVFGVGEVGYEADCQFKCDNVWVNES
jgi:hypothetical protein